MNNAETILTCLDQKLQTRVELILYGRAALLLGFDHPLDEYALSRDVDAVLWKGQAEMLLETTNFWEAVNQVNDEMADQELYISHFFEEDQVILRPNWRNHLKKIIKRTWPHLALSRLGDIDLLLSKLMRDDPLDREDAIFIYEQGRLNMKILVQALKQARIPDIPEIREQFELASSRFLEAVQGRSF